MADDRRSAIDTTVPHSARVWNYLLGGKDHYPVDRTAGDMVLQIFPGMADLTRQSRLMLVRMVKYLAGEAGIRQFLDIGTGVSAASPDARASRSGRYETGLSVRWNAPRLGFHSVPGTRPPVL